MKPLILTMQAFGPFAGREVLDFRPALETGLFGIYGPTGAGKSSIFSAMTLALFGEDARGGKTIVPALRSGHAAADLITEVELIFEVGGRRYRVVRRPKQLRQKTRGSGETADGPFAWLFDVTDLMIDDIGAERPGKVIAEKSVQAVDAAVVEVLGYKVEQFRQIVLLPQGKFETFLAAKTEERGKILKDLFDVSLYRALTERLKTEADDVQSRINRGRDICLERLRAEGFENREALADGLAAATLTSTGLKDELTEIEAHAIAARAAYESAARTDEAFRAHLDAERVFAAIAARDAEIALLGEEARLVRAAASLADADAALDAARRRAGLAAAERDRTALARERCDADLIEAKAALVRAEADVEQLPARQDRLHALGQQREAWRKAEGLRDVVAERKAHVAEQARDIERIKALCDGLTAELTQVERAIQTEQARRADRERLKSEFAAVQAELKAAKAFEELAADVKRREIAARRAEADANDADAELAQAEACLARIEAAVLADHAHALASTLTSGAPCPVCGSPDHPRPARRVDQSDELVVQRRGAIAARDAARRRASSAAAHSKSAAELLELRRGDLAALDPPTVPASEIEGRSAQIAAAVQHIGPPVDLGLQANRLEALRAEHDAARLRLEQAAQAREAAATSLAVSENAFHEALSAVDENLRAAGALDQEIARIAAENNQLQRALTAARDRERQAGLAAASARQAGSYAAEIAEQALQEHEEAAERFERRLAELGFDGERYARAKAAVLHVETLEARVAEHQNQKLVAGERLKDCEARIKGAHRPDIAALLGARERADEAVKLAARRLTEAEGRVAHLDRLGHELDARLAALDAEEAQSGALRELNQMFTGKRPPYIDLETFAISTMFDTVLAAANQRLGPMSLGRYRLVRSDDDGNRGKRGLGIAVDDTYTGRERPAATLSGGETFIAALSLALGLSDVVEATQGRISLDTIFIDEGFGSLDTDGTLDQVLNTLQDLIGKSRTVGIVSHVPIVQQTVPNGFYVAKTASGSTIEPRH